jgi:flagellar assembly protein FliH
LSRIIRSSQIITVQSDNKANKDSELTVKNLTDEAENIVREAYEKSKLIVEKAERESETIVEKAIEESQEKSELIEEESRQRGYESGYSEGYEKGQIEGHESGYEKAYSETLEKRKEIIEEANLIKSNYLIEREKIINDLEPDIINLVREISEKVINREIEKPDYMVDLILKGLSSLNDKDNIIIRVSKEDYEKVNEFKPEILSKGSLIEDIDIKLDSNLKKGDCVIESSQGNVNTSISLQLEEIRKILDDLLLGSRKDE